MIAAPPAGITFDLYLRSYERSLRARGLAERTVESYLGVLRVLRAYCERVGMPTDPTVLTREHVEAFLADFAKHNSYEGAFWRARHLGPFFKWLVEQDEIDENPMRHIKMKRPPDPQTPVLNVEQLERLFAACKGKTFRDARDRAMMRLLLDTGMRRQELLSLRYGDLDWELEQLTIRPKGGGVRVVPLGDTALRDLERYLRNYRYGRGDSDAMWTTEKGTPLASRTMVDVLRHRGERAGIYGLHPHVFRHTFASMWLEAGGSEIDLMRITGWKNPRMLQRYGAAAADDRAKKAHRRFSPADRV